MTDFQPGAVTLHLIPEEVWDASADASAYVPDAFAADGFVHCTDGDDNLVAVGNRYYAKDPRAYLALTISIDRLASPVRYDDAAHIFPHIYGPINRDAVTGKRRVLRSDDGSFLAIDSNEIPL